jgi:hypothetical protein
MCLGGELLRAGREARVHGHGVVMYVCMCMPFDERFPQTRMHGALIARRSWAGGGYHRKHEHRHERCSFTLRYPCSIHVRLHSEALLLQFSAVCTYLPRNVAEIHI